MNKSKIYDIKNCFLYTSKNEETKNIEEIKKKLLNIFSGNLRIK